MNGSAFPEKAANRQRVVLEHLSQVTGLSSKVLMKEAITLQ